MPTSRATSGPSAATTSADTVDLPAPGGPAMPRMRRLPAVARRRARATSSLSSGSIVPPFRRALARSCHPVGVRRSMVACLLLGVAACGASTPAAARPDPFDAQRAYALTRLQVGYGQRPAGSPQLRKLAERLRVRLPGGHFEPAPGQPGVRNVVGTLPGRRPGIVVGAHYDTLVKPEGF